MGGTRSRAPHDDSQIRSGAPKRTPGSHSDVSAGRDRAHRRRPSAPGLRPRFDNGKGRAMVLQSKDCIGSRWEDSRGPQFESPRGLPCEQSSRRGPPHDSYRQYIRRHVRISFATMLPTASRTAVTPSARRRHTPSRGSRGNAAMSSRRQRLPRQRTELIGEVFGHSEQDSKRGNSGRFHKKSMKAPTVTPVRLPRTLTPGPVKACAHFHRS